MKNEFSTKSQNWKIKKHYFKETKMLANLIFKRTSRLFNGSLIQLQLKRFSDVNKDLNMNQQKIFKENEEKSKQDKKDLEEKEKQFKGITEYQQALSYYHQGKYTLSDELFRTVLIILENGGQQDTENYSHILKK